jgi:hypothetical protein
MDILFTLFTLSGSNNSKQGINITQGERDRMTMLLIPVEMYGRRRYTEIEADFGTCAHVEGGVRVGGDAAATQLPIVL